MTFGTQYKQSSNGRQKLSDGLEVHKGLLDVAGLRVNNVLFPRDGAGGAAGVEVLYVPGTGPGYVQAYDREHGNYVDLQFAAKNIVVNPQQGGKFQLLPAGISPLIGSYEAALNYTVPSINVWTETPVQAPCTFTGAPLRIDWNTSISNPGKGATVYVGIGINGTLQWPSRALFNTPEANYIVSVSGTIYWPSPSVSGAGRCSIWLYTGSSGTAINPGAYNALYVTEMRA